MHSFPSSLLTTNHVSKSLNHSLPLRLRICSPRTRSPAQVSVKFNDSSLRAFPPSASDGKIAGDSGPPPDADVTFSKPIPCSSEQPAANWAKAFTVTAYQPYFDVDTSDVLERVKDSLSV